MTLFTLATVCLWLAPADLPDARRFGVDYEGAVANYETARRHWAYLEKTDPSVWWCRQEYATRAWKSLAAALDERLPMDERTRALGTLREMIGPTAWHGCRVPTAITTYRP